MNLSMTGELGDAYTSGAQRARVVTEAWGENNLYCPNCSSRSLMRLSNNTKASDYSCPICHLRYQLKGQRTRIGNSIPDGAYTAMMEAIRRDETPNFYFLQYDLATWNIKNLLLIPSFAFPSSAIIKRKPLSPSARRAGWVGCNLDLSRIPAEARIQIVTTCSSGRKFARSSSPAGNSQSRLTSAATIITLPQEVRSQFRRVKPLGEIKSKERGWTLDVLNTVRQLGKTEFTTTDAYSFAGELEALHPDNRHVKDKIRQQLQVLRDVGLLIHIERGIWRLP